MIGSVFAVPPAAVAAASPSPQPSPAATATPRVQFTVGGDVRVKYEHYFDKYWDPRPGGDGYVLDRELLDLGLKDGRFAAGAEVEHATASGYAGVPDPTWRDDLATPSIWIEDDGVRVGRMRLRYGSGRMIDDRFGLNTLQAFDGVRARFGGGGWQTDVFWAVPVVVSPYAFDDGENRRNALFGAYATHAYGENTLDLYALGDQRQSQFAFRGPQPETRYTLGTRYAVDEKHLALDWEAAGQFGSFGGATIDAYDLETSTAWSWNGGRNRWTAGIYGGSTSGDHSPGTSRMTAFIPR